ncbi:MAG: hypothetical protein CMM08_17625 [Rhodospirillaceae bacterium]|jgi:hypothetical protein|nr:hypothetical protein [Rhodospirillaceae bacterium]|tara:strand:- start:44 stop:373 length:330 start_codon:yes stop_codon:yes gene_type:complete
MDAKWLLLIVLLGGDDGARYEPIPYACEKHCIAAAQEFVRQYPAFEWRDHRPSGDLLALVVRPHVECQPNRMPDESAEAKAGEESETTREQCPVSVPGFPAHDRVAEGP